MTEDPLDAVFVKPEQVADEQRTLLVKMISPFAYMEAENGRVHFRSTENDLNAKQKLIVYLVCRLARSHRLGPKFTAEATPKEIENETSMAGGTVRPKLIQLAEERIAIKKGDGYMIPAENLTRAYKELESVLTDN